MKTSTYLFLLLLLSFVGFSCSDDSDDSLDIPETYDGSAFATNAATELQVLTQLSALVSEMQKGRAQGTTVDAATLLSLYQSGTPSVQDVTASYYDNLLVGSDGYLTQLAAASGGTYTVGTPQGEGGVLGAYLFDENGMELEQLVEKGLYGAALYNHAITIFSNDMTAADVDRLVAIYGATPAFSNTSNGATPDNVLAKYAARRDKNDGNGFYTTIASAFITLQAAVRGGADFQEEQTEALNIIKDNWEKANAATVINYCFAAIDRLSSTNPDDATVAAALHAYAEGVGFLHGWKPIPDAHKTITNTQIDNLLVQMNAPAGQPASSYLFASDPVAELPKLQAVVNELQAIYGFSNAQLEDFKKNWINEQNR